MAIRQEYRKIDNGMVYQKDWPFAKLFNHHLLKLRERGILHQIQSVHLEYKKEDCGKREPRVIGLINIATLGLILMAGVIIAGVIFIVEMMIWPKIDKNVKDFWINKSDRPL